MWLRGSPVGEGSASGACTELGWIAWVRAGAWLPPGEVEWLTPEHSAQGSTRVTARQPARGAHTPVGLLPQARHPVHAPRAGSASPVQPKEPCPGSGAWRGGQHPAGSRRVVVIHNYGEPWKVWGLGGAPTCREQNQLPPRGRTPALLGSRTPLWPHPLLGSLGAQQDGSCLCTGHSLYLNAVPSALPDPNALITCRCQSPAAGTRGDPCLCCTPSSSHGHQHVRTQ